ncbi:transposon Ty3-G Gag-Pol polyprotein [Elysia marginata]|uniref:Transposon Ty3-G Gag-Pol polyprotein n=1 Tax=Elysia marginata TaxID=1093978 RepID=A0AAV4FAK9_9GAST|nr:transposon Ty3-G Gag-Pol polyprotein [Elysia marginata]
MINFYNRFIRNAAAILKPLYEAQGKSKPQEPLDWSDVMTEAFSSSKTALVNATMLTHPAHGAPIALTSDASDVAVGAILEQLSNGSWQPLAFFSKQLRPAEKKYSTFDRELLGLYLAVKHFRYFLEGRRFAMFTDHKPLVGAISKLSDPWTARQQRHLAHISEFSTDIRHISGKANVVADCLSRATINNVVLLLLGIDYKAMAETQEHDSSVENGNHWPQLTECLAGQSSKIKSHVRSPIVKIPVPEKRISHIHIDLVGSLPPSEGFTYLLTIIDRSSRWPEAVPITNTSASKCAKALIRHWIARFGVPLDMTSDRGSQFTSALWTEMANQLGIQLHRTSAYHPQSNGLVERFHRTLKAALKTRLKGPNWADELPWVLLGLRTVPMEDLQE